MNPGKMGMSDDLGGFSREIASGGLAIGSAKGAPNVRLSPGRTEAKTMILRLLGVDKAPEMEQDFGCRREGIAKQLQNPRRGWKR